MFIPEIPETVQSHARSLVTDPSPLPNAKFILDSTSVAGLLGGEEAMSTVALAQIYDRRKWLGWYNTPGSYIIGKRFRRLARSIVSDSHVNTGSGVGSETVHIDPALLLQHDGWSKGPVFKGIHSGSSLQETGPLASFLMKKCIKMSGTPIEGRRTQPVNVTIVRLEKVPSLQMKFRHSPPIGAIIPIAVSLITCVTCGLYREWYAFSMILLGILARGLTCLFIGSGELSFDHPKSAEGSPPGDGILGCDHELVLLKGDEDIVNAITRGRFFFSFQSRHACRMVELCSFFLIVQAIAQLICVPQSDLFGQLMFVVSIATSWVYNLWFLSVDKAKIRQEIYHSVLGSPTLEKFVFPNRCSAVVSLLLSLDDQTRSGDEEKLKRIMDNLLPSGALVWERWKGIVIEHVKNGRPLHFDDTHRNRQGLPSDAASGSSTASNRVLSQTTLTDAETVSLKAPLTGADTVLLRGLLTDAETARAAFRSNK
ncbi:hypothetical protein EDC04DRAFT_1004047 [Pisolithus marmoratus]|nr:hypothetical protein EDC04DRAFT_1004047 [Pisolithus marmoratus]